MPNMHLPQPTPQRQPLARAMLLAALQAASKRQGYDGTFVDLPVLGVPVGRIHAVDPQAIADLLFPQEG